MNLAAYDVMEFNLNISTYIRPEYKRLYSNQMEYHRYYAYLSNYDPQSKTKDYYIALMDNPADNILCRQTRQYCNTLKFELSGLWKELNLSRLTETTKVDIEEIDVQEDGVIYKLMF